MLTENRKAAIGGVLEKGYSENRRKIRRKTSMLVSLFNNVADL